AAAEPLAPVSLPEAPALLSTEDGLVVRATEQAAHLAGVRDPQELTGQRLSELVVRSGPAYLLRAPDGDLAVRPTPWPAPEDAVPANTDDERRRLLEAQRLSQIGSWMFYPDTGEFYRSPVLAEFLGFSEADTEDIFALIGSTYPEDRERAERFYAELLATST